MQKKFVSRVLSATTATGHRNGIMAAAARMACLALLALPVISIPATSHAQNLSIEGSGTIRIWENNPAEHVVRVVSDTVLQRDVTFRIWLSPQSGNDVATPGKDYRHFDEEITMLRGTEEIAVTLPIIDDEDMEKLEHVNLNLCVGRDSGRDADRDASNGRHQDCARANRNRESLSETYNLETREIRILSEERIFIGYPKTHYEVTEGDSIEICADMFIIDSDIYDGEDYFHAATKVPHSDNGRIEFDFGVSLSSFTGTATINDDYVDFPSNLLSGSRGWNHTNKLCKTLETVDDGIAEPVEYVGFIMERLPGLNEFAVLSTVIADPVLYPRTYDEFGDILYDSPQIIVLIHDNGRNSGGTTITLDAQKTLNKNEVDLSWNPVAGATRYEVLYRQKPYLCRLGSTIRHTGSAFDTVYDITGDCPWNRIKIGGGSSAREFLVTARNTRRAECAAVGRSSHVDSDAYCTLEGGKEAEFRVIAYGPDPTDPTQTIVTGASAVQKVTPRKVTTAQVGCFDLTHDVIIDQGLPNVDDSITAEQAMCIGDVESAVGENEFHLGWHPAQGAGVYDDSDGQARAPHYRVEWKRTDSADANDWGNAESALVNDLRPRRNSLGTPITWTIPNLDSGVEYMARVIALGTINGLPSKVLRGTPETGSNEGTWRLVADPAGQIAVFGQDSYRSVCVRLERSDGADFTLSEDFPVSIATGGTATPGVDYRIASATTIPSGTNQNADPVCVTLNLLSPRAEGQTEKTIRIRFSHGYQELPATFMSVDSVSAVVTIQEPAQFRIRAESRLSVGEGDTTHLVCFNLVHADGTFIDYTEYPDLEARVTVATSDGTATSVGSEDYFALEDTITFRANAVHECRVFFIAKDTIGEPDETFFVNAWYSGAEPFALGGTLDPVTVKVTIKDDDGYRLVLEDQNGDPLDRETVEEGVQPVQDICVRLERTDEAAFTLSEDFPVIFSASGTATEGPDYRLQARVDGNWTNVDLPASLNIDQSSKKVCARLRIQNGEYNIELDETVDITVRHGHSTLPSTFEGYVAPVSAPAFIIRDNDVAEIRLEKTVFEMREGETLDIGIEVQSVNADVDCVLELDVDVRVSARPHTATLKEDPDYPLVPGREPYPSDPSQLNRDLPDEMVDGYYIDRVVTLPACSTRVTVPWHSFDDPFIERQTEQIFVALHRMPGTPAGVRVHGRSRVDILDNDRIDFLFSDLVEKQVGGRTRRVASYTATEGDTIDIGYTAGDGVEFPFSLGVNDPDNTGLVRFPVGNNLRNRLNLYVPPYTAEGSFKATLGNVDADTVVYLKLDSSLLRFQDSIRVPGNQLVEITIRDAGAVTGFELVDASDDTDLGAIGNGDTLSLSATGLYGIRARVDPNDGVGSVVMTLEGPGAADTHTQTESLLPYSLYGDAPGGANGGRAEHGRVLPAGSYTLTATAYAERGGAGEVLGARTVAFTVGDAATTPPVSTGPLAGLVLVDTSDKSEVAITDGAVIDLTGREDRNYTIRADLNSGADVGSVAMLLTGAKRVQKIESKVPYVLYGDRRGGRDLMGEPLPAGSYTMTATAWSGGGGAGVIRGNMSVSFEVLDAAVLSVADASAEEGTDEALDFVVTLSRQSADTVFVNYATGDGTATAPADYTAMSGTLSFAAGETTQTVSVPIVNDAHNEGSETMTLTLSGATGATITDDRATGTISNDGHIPEAWLARFGRTVTGQVLDAVETRLSATRAVGVEARLAGEALPSSDEAAASLASWLAPAEPDRGLMSQADAPGGVRFETRALTERDFLVGTSFAMTAQAGEGGGFASLWGNASVTGFDGRRANLTLDGEVTTGLIGVDWAADNRVMGLALGHSRGTGNYRGAEGSPGMDGKIEATLTGLYPYAGIDLTDRLSVWAAAGHGTGEVTVTPSGGADLTADLSMSMLAAGLRNEVLRPAGSGLSLAVKGDARFTRTSSDAVDGALGGNLAAADADVWLLRAGIEGSQTMTLTAGATLTPSFGVGLRLDGGDAETGMGADIGGGLAFADPASGLTLDLKARGLLAHEASGFREWGASIAASWDPRPTTDRGPALSLTQTWGASPSGGMDALLSRETLAGLAADDSAGTFGAAGRLEGELGYGIAMFGGGFTGTPNVGFALSDGGAREWRVGWRLSPGGTARGDFDFGFSLDATRRDPAGGGAPEHAVALKGALRW